MATEAATSPAAATENPDKVRVLIVDDSRVIRKAINRILVNDAEIIEAEDGEDGWNQLLGDDSIQVMVTDIEMPRLDGYQLICRVRAHDDNRVRSVPIITITGADDEETRARAFACGATDFITKPIDKVQLKARVQAHAKLDETSRQLEETTLALEEESTSDPLTGLASRKYLMQRAEQDLAHAKRHSTELSLLRIDIDGFKKLYRDHGDDISDQIIKWVSEKLTATARREDTVARVGGAEFAVLAPATGKTEAAVLGDRLRKAVNRLPFVAGKKDIPVTISIGLAAFGTDSADDLAQLFSLVEDRLRHARGDGGDAVSVTTRSEAMPGPEEVTLGGSADTGTVEQAFATETGTVGFSAASDDKSVEELEAEIVYEVGGAPSADYSSKSKGSAGPVDIDLVDINQALYMLANGASDSIAPYALELARKILPLLELSNREHRLGLDEELDSLKEKLYGDS